VTTEPSRQSRRQRRRRGATVFSVLGEILVTAGVVVLMYTSWQLWIGDAILGVRNNAEGSALAEEWAQAYEQDEPTLAPAPSPTATATEAPEVTAEPIVRGQPQEGEEFGIVYIPRFGADYMVKVAGGVNARTSLNVGAIGHYPDTAMPGEMGNFAVAAHRGSHGAPFMNLPMLTEGDAVVVETQEGWYTYRYRNSEYVTPSSVDVLNPVPRQEGVPANGRYITMTTCSPRYGFSERLVAYGVFESFTPRSAGAPSSLEVPV
jgi:sortase A